jgi:hypothetical protein
MKILTAIWEFFEAWGEHRYQLAKKRGYRYHY